MKKNKLTALYIIWVIFHFFLWFYAGSWGWYSSYNNLEMNKKFWLEIKSNTNLELEKFYPFLRNSRYWYFDPKGIYDLSELVIYIILPLLLYSIYWLWTKDKKEIS
jgi:hypothetical protein